MVALAGFAEEHSLDGAARTQCFFDEAHAFDADEAVFGGEAAAESHAKLFEPAIVAADEERRLARGFRVAGGFARGRHNLEVSKLQSN